MILGQPSAHLGFASERKRLTAPTMSARPAGLSAPASSFRGQQIKAPTFFSMCRQTVLIRQTTSQRPQMLGRPNGHSRLGQRAQADIRPAGFTALAPIKLQR